MIHQVKDLYSAEDQLVNALPKMAENAKDDKLKKAIEDHLEETKNQKKRLEQVCQTLNVSPEGEHCKAMEGLIKESKHFLEEDTDNDVRNAGIIAEAQRVEHYEISGYGTAVRYAKELGLDDVANTLKQTLDEEYAADEKLNAMAEDRLNRKAISHN